METRQPRWRRRSADRPQEIVAAALTEFAARGYAGARVADIAAAAGVSKAALFTYFPTKADLLEAVVAAHLAPRVAGTRGAAAAPGRFADRLPALLGQLAAAMAKPELRRIARMIIAESGNFPEIARAWHGQVVAPALSAIAGAVAEAQAAGEARAGDPRLMAMSITGPMLMGLLWREVMEPAGGAPLDLDALAAEHLRTVLGGFAPVDAATP